MSTELTLFYLVGILIIFSSSLTVFFGVSRLKWLVPLWVSPFLVILFAYIPVLQILKLYSMHMYVDFGHWEEILWNIIQSGLPLSQSSEFIYEGTENYFSTHFVPLVYLLAVPFKIWPYGETLIVMNFIIIASSIIPLWKLSRRLGFDKNMSLIWLAIFLWNVTVQYITIYEFEVLRFSIPIFLWILYFLEERRWREFYVLLIIAILIREDVSLTILMFGLYVCFFLKDFRHGLPVVTVSAVYFILVTQLVMPSLNEGGVVPHLNFLSYFFANLNNPDEFFINLFDPIKLANIFMIFLPLLFFPLFGWRILTCCFAVLGVGMLSKSYTHLAYMLYYVSASLPFLYYALLKSWPQLLTFLKRFPGVPYDNILLGKALQSMLFTSTIVTCIIFGPSPISLQFWLEDVRPYPFRTQRHHYSAFEVNDHHRIVPDFVNLIPDNAIVSAEQFFASHLFKKKAMMVFPQLINQDRSIEADYVIIDKFNPLKTGSSNVPGSWNGLRENPKKYYDIVENDSTKWELLKKDDGIFLFKRKY
tara:strand:+ start:546 stop:2141 length:1596 start_codon:yes stop_codon:yes gene_type:complete